MTLNPAARATARRNVADRFDRFLDGLQRARRQPSKADVAIFTSWMRRARMFLRQKGGSMRKRSRRGLVKRVVIDTDPGVDDAQAILFALRLPALRIEAVTTVFGNCDVATATRNARTLLELGQAANIPVFKGAGKSLIGRRCKYARLVHGRYGFGSFKPPEPAYPQSKGYAAA